MKIQPYQPANMNVNTNTAKSKDNKSKEINIETETVKSDVYVPGKKEESITYKNKIAKTYQNDIKKLKEQTEATYNSLRKIVLELLQRQGYTVGKLDRIDNEKMEVKVDETARQEASKLVADDGPLGAEAVSNRIVDFAIAISGGDKSKLEELKAAIKEGFKQVEEMLGSLPEVSQRTYDMIMEKLDNWAVEV